MKNVQILIERADGSQRPWFDNGRLLTHAEAFAVCEFISKHFTMLKASIRVMRGAGA